MSPRSDSVKKRFTLPRSAEPAGARVDARLLSVGTMPRLLLTAVVLAASAGAADASAAPSVWIIDDGEKIRQDATSTPFERGEQNPVWHPGAPVRVFAMRGESIALQVVVGADGVALDAVTVELRSLAGPRGAELAEPRLAPADAMRTVGRPIERFVEHFVTVRRHSGGRAPGESLGWEASAGPPPGAWVGAVPDALVPVELAAAVSGYPMRLEPRRNGIVWIDVNVPPDQAAGAYRGAVDVRDGPRGLASIPVELEVVDARLPDSASEAVVYYDPEDLARRVGAGAEPQLWKLLHAHRVAPLHDAKDPDDVRRQRAALDGSLYETSAGYLGPDRGVGDGVLCLGAYGGLGEPRSTPLEALADAVATQGVPRDTEVFLYADDERCGSPRGAAWSALVHGSSDPSVRRIRVGWTCSEDPAAQPVDIPMLHAGDYDVARAARAADKEVWVYNGVVPRSGTFLLDADAVSPRVNGWIGEMFHVARWLYWESTYWYGRRGEAPIDPFADAESFHNASGDWANGDGVLLYPGRQLDVPSTHSLGFEGVLPSIRLKNWRRGLEDAGYLRLARARDGRRANAVADALVPSAFRAGGARRWSAHGEAFFDARRALLAIALGPVAPVSAITPPAGATGPDSPPSGPSGVARGASGFAARWDLRAAMGACAAAAFALGLAARRGRRRRGDGADSSPGEVVDRVP
jgi:hypothetical protein